MPFPRKMRKATRISVFLPYEHIQLGKHLAQEQDMTFARYLRQALAQALQRDVAAMREPRKKEEA